MTEVRCTYCEHPADEHGEATDDFPTGCMHFDDDDERSTYRDAENCQGHCLCPALVLASDPDAQRLGGVD
jgi:hypothetical protein